MSKKVLVLVSVLTVGAGIAGLLILNQKRQNAQIEIVTETKNEQEQAPSLNPITARFEIYTLGTKRIFTDPKYHDLSEKVYITSEDPGTVVVNQPGIAWADLFATLPMSLSEECLTTGTGQTFCTTSSNQLKFFINDIEDPQALNQTIREGDKLLVIYE